jgi:hypothetical protein
VEELVTLKVKENTRDKLKVIAAEQRITMYEMLDKLIEEYQRGNNHVHS